MARYTATSKTGKTSALCDYFSLRGGYGTKATTAVKCTTDDEVLEAMIRQVEGHDFVFGRLMQLANVQGCEWIRVDVKSADGAGNGESHVPSSGDDPAVTLDSALEALNRRLTALHNALPRNTALIVLNGHSDPLPMLDLTARRARWERLVKTRGGTEGVTGEQRWLAEDDRRLEEAVGEAREGMAFFCVK
jgi:RNA exonuclease 1